MPTEPGKGLCDRKKNGGSTQMLAKVRATTLGTGAQPSHPTHSLFQLAGHGARSPPPATPYTYKREVVNSLARFY